MYQKRILCGLISTLVCTSTFAGGFYLGPSVFFQDISAKYSSFTGARPRVAVGYGTNADNFYIAAEVFASPVVKTFSNSNRNAVTAKATQVYGVSVLPGMMLNDQFMGFLRIGVVSARFAGPSTSRKGFMGGAGIQTNLVGGWEVRGEYDYAAYQSVSGLGSPKSNEIGVGVIYQFSDL